MAYTKDIGIKDFYEYYVNRAIKKNREYLDYKTFSTIFKEANKLIREKIIYKSETLHMPDRLGSLNIKKFSNSFQKDKQWRWKVDYKASKEAGHIIYHGASFGYRWRWDKDNCRLSGRKWYLFKPSRTASRLIADAIKNKNVDYYN